MDPATFEQGVLDWIGNLPNPPENFPLHRLGIALTLTSATPTLTWAQKRRVAELLYEQYIQLHDDMAPELIDPTKAAIPEDPDFACGLAFEEVKYLELSDINEMAASLQINPSALRLICSRLLVDLADPAAQCTFALSQLKVSVQVSTGTMRYFATLTSTMLIPAAVWVSRRALTQLAFTVAPRVVVSVDKQHIEKQVLITTAPVAAAHQDLQLTYELLDPAVCVGTTAFTVIAATLNGVDQPQTILDANSDLSTPLVGKYIIAAARLPPQLSITSQLLLIFCDGTTSKMSSQTAISSLSQKSFQIKQTSRFVRYRPLNVVELWFELLVGSFNNADWVVKLDGVVVPAAQVVKKGFSEPGIFVLQYTPPAGLSGFWLEVSYPNSVSEYIRFESKPDALFPSFIVPSRVQVAQPIEFWTSFGAELTYKAVCISRVADLTHFATLEKPSTYVNNLGQGISSTDFVSLFLILTSLTPVQILRFDFDVVNNMPQPANTLRSFWEFPLTLMYRDGSAMHSSAADIILGFPSTNYVASLPSSPAPSLSTYSTSGVTITTPTLATTGNKITCSLPSSPTAPPSAATLTTSYTTPATLNPQYLSYRPSIYRSTPLPTTPLAVHQSLSSPSRLLLVLPFASTDNKPLLPDKTVLVWPVGVTDVGVSTANKVFVPVAAVLPLGRAFGAFEVGRVVVEAVQPFGLVKVALEYFDGHAFAVTEGKVLGVQAPRAGVGLQDGVDEWRLELPAIFDSLAGVELVRSMALEAHQLNQITARCRYAPGCTIVLNTTLATLRWDILTRFMSYWDTLTDKSPWDSWENSAMKSSLLNSLGYDSNKATDNQINWYSQEIFKDSQAIIDFTSQKRSTVSRLSFTLGEMLKSLGSLTLRNLNLLTSSAAYSLQMYAKTYAGFTSPQECETTVNKIFTLLRGLNEVKLIRYTHVSTSSLFATDLLAIGGLSIVEPLQSSYTVWIGDSVAVELKNLKFNPPLDIYELSVIVMEDSLFDSVANLLDKFNLTSSLNKSRTSVGFTNKFGPVTPQIEPDTEINVYRSDEECRGTPCNRNKQLTSGSSTIILCECLTTASAPLAAPKSPDSPPISPQTPPKPETFTNTVTKTAEKFSQATSSGAGCLFGSPAKCVPEKRIWMNSVMAIFCLMSVVSVLACAIDSKLLAPCALKCTIKAQLKLMATYAMETQIPGSSQLQVVSEGQSDPFGQEPEDAVINQGSNSSGGGYSATKCFRGLSSDQTHRVSQALKKVGKDPVIDNILRTTTFEKLSRFKIFLLMAQTAHPIASILTSPCKLVSRKTNIFVLYVRWVYELALSMFFNMGLGQDSPNQLAILFVRCLYSIACVTVFAGIIKKFVRYDTQFNLSAVGFCLPKLPVKKAVANQDNVFKMETKDSVQTPVSPAVSVNPIRKKTQRRNWTSKSNNPSIQKISPANSVIIDRKFALDQGPDTEQEQQRQSGKVISTEELPSPQNQSKGQVYDPADDKCRNLVFILMSYITMYTLLLGSIFVIIAVNQANDESGQWPFGYWYAFQFFISSVFGSLFSIFVQFQLLLYRLKILKAKPAKTPWLATRHLFCNGEVYELADMICPSSQSLSTTSETQIKSSSPSMEELPQVPEEQRHN